MLYFRPEPRRKGGRNRKGKGRKAMTRQRRWSKNKLIVFRKDRHGMAVVQNLKDEEMGH